MLESWIMMMLEAKKIEKKIDKSRLVQITIVLILLINVVFSINNVGQLIDTENGSKIWGLIYGLQGGDWSSYMESGSTISFLYSLFLVPVSLVLKSSVATYKVGILMNSFLLVCTFFLSINILQKIMPNKSKTFLTIICSILLIFPGYFSVCYIANPDILMLSIFVIDIYILYSICNNPSFKKILVLGIFLGLGVMVHAFMICVAISGIIALILMVRDSKVKENHVLVTILVVIFIVLIGNGLEKYWLLGISERSDTSIKSSLSIFFEGIYSGLINYNIFEILQSAITKFYSIVIGSCFIFLYGIWYLIRKTHLKKDEFYKKILYCFSGLSIFLVYIASTLGDMSTNNFEQIFDSSIVFLFLGPIIILGIIEFVECKNWMSHLSIIIIIAIGLTFGVGKLLLQVDNSNINFYNFGIVSTFYKYFEDYSIVNQLYLLVTIITIILCIVAFLFHTNIKNSIIKKINIVLALVFSGFLFILFNYSLITNDIFLINKDVETNYARLISLTDITSENNIFFICDNSNQIDDALKLQFLLGGKKLNVVTRYSSNSKDYDLKINNKFVENIKSNNDMFVLMSSSSNNIEEYMSKFQIIDLTKKLALFSKSSSEDESLLLNEIENRIYTVENEDTTALSPGTYDSTVEIKVNSIGDNGVGTLQVMNGNTVVSKMEITDTSSMLNNKLTINLPFTTEKILKTVSYKIIPNSGSDLEIKNVIYRQKNNKLNFGMNNENKLKQIISIINKLDNVLGMKGKVCIARDNTKLDTSTEYMSQLLPNNKVFSNSNDSSFSDADYYIFSANDRLFYNYLDEYVILEMNDNYILMTRKESKQAKNIESIGKDILSIGKNIDIRAFLKKTNGKYDYNTPINLMSGNFNYALELVSSNENLSNIESEELVKIILMNSDEIIAEKMVSSTDFKNGIAEIKIPISSPTTIKSLSYKIEGSESVYCKPIYLEMLSAKFEIGSDERTAINKISNVVNNIKSNSNLYYVTSLSNKARGIYSTSELQKLCPDNSVRSSTRSEVEKINQDCFLLIKDFNSDMFRLTKKYTMIALESNYSLWAKSDGQILLKALENGVVPLSNGERLPATIFGYDETDQKLVDIPSGNYRISIDITKVNFEDGDKVFLELVNQISDQTINKDIDSLINNQIDNGLVESNALDDEAYRNSLRNTIKEKTILSTYEVDNKIFHNSDSALVTIDIRSDIDIDNLSLNIINVGKSNIKTKMCWIERKD